MFFVFKKVIIFARSFNATVILIGSVWLNSELMNLDNSSEHRKKAMRSSPVLYIYHLYTEYGREPLSYRVEAVESPSVGKLAGLRLSFCVPKTILRTKNK